METKKSAVLKQSKEAMLLAKERLLYVSLLRNVPHIPRVPPVDGYGTVQNLRFMAMDMLGVSLSRKAQEAGGRLSTAAIAHVGKQCVREELGRRVEGLKG